MAYPSFLPQPVRDGYTAGPTQQYQRTLMDDGQYSQIRRWSNVPMGYKLTWHLNFKQAQLFEAWLEYDAGRGIGPIDIPIAGKTVRCKPVTGMPEYRLDGFRWVVSMDVVEYQTIPVLSTPRVVLPEWPVELPSFENTEFQYGKVNAMLVSDQKAGPSESRVRFRDRVSNNVAKIVVSLEQRNIFWEFYRNQLLGGVSWFHAEFSNAYSQGKQRVRLIEPPKETPNGAWFNISISVEMVRAPMMTTEEYRENFTLVNDYVEAGYVESGYVGYYIA